MTDRYLLRQTAMLGLAANAIRPLPSMPLSPVSFFSGWLTSELAPQLLGVLAVDNAVHLARHGLRRRGDKAGLTIGALAGAGLAASIAAGRGTHQELTRALEEAIGPDAAAGDGPLDSTVPWRKLAMPFRMRNADVVRERNIAYTPTGRRGRLDVYHHRDTGERRPILLQIHGGGWVIGNKDQQGIPLMLEMASRGWVCAAVNYPLSPRAHWPDHLIAIKRAVAWLREHAVDYGADPDFIAVTGGSAGGHLAAMLALTANDPGLQPGFADTDTSIQACVPHYGVYDFAGETGIKAVRQRVESPLSAIVLGRNAQFPRDYLAASPMAHLRADAPPFFVLHGENDSLVPVAEAREFVARLREVSRNPVAYAELHGAQHAFDVFPSLRSVQAVQAVARFLEWSRTTVDNEGATVAAGAGQEGMGLA
ncbi:alpha/beta hydrolase [Rhodococcus sp. D2-41]|uniref:alpha/beta hydrolase n=1 Tax=Speluncibacter jeojiensis TaxID=2710754 RepID=UPI00240F73CF|nr:alpha/beta hydrolase [Rhodococcus sp. D2-41]MDG3011378.1 alpha/beta hydrolase [Rhodococcus sp. D2-41]